ncbi:MAG: porin family protein [Flavobacteriaceae bacterium]|nr:porin family protein [Flavobacteriaceae bacterium]
MKKVLFTVLFFTGFLITAEAQEIADNAIGIRFGDNNGFGTEVNYQRAIGGNNRLEFGLGWTSNRDLDAFKLTGLYQWVWNIDGGFNWYAGAGGGVGSIDFDRDFPGNPDNETFIFAAGTVGIEYNFDIPLMISLDFRPEIGFGDYRDDLDFDIGLGLRYQF